MADFVKLTIVMNVESPESRETFDRVLSTLKPYVSDERGQECFLTKIEMGHPVGDCWRCGGLVFQKRTPEKSTFYCDRACGPTTEDQLNRRAEVP